MTTTNTDPTDLLAELQARVKRCEDLEVLRGLKAEYAVRADALMKVGQGENAANMLALFTEDSSIDLGPFGRYVGREQMSHAFHNVLPGGTSWSIHYMTNPQIAIDGDTAIGTWYLLLVLQPRTPEGAPKAPTMTIYGRYRDKFVRTQDGWKFSEVVATLDAPPA